MHPAFISFSFGSAHKISDNSRASKTTTETVSPHMLQRQTSYYRHQNYHYNHYPRDDTTDTSVPVRETYNGLVATTQEDAVRVSG